MKLVEDLRKSLMVVRPNGYLSLDILKGEENESDCSIACACTGRNGGDYR